MRSNTASAHTAEPLTAVCMVRQLFESYITVVMENMEPFAAHLAFIALHISGRTVLQSSSLALCLELRDLGRYHTVKTRSMQRSWGLMLVHFEANSLQIILSLKKISGFQNFHYIRWARFTELCTNDK